MGRTTGDKGAQGVPGGEAIAVELDRMAAEGGVKGLHAKLNYLVGSVGGQEAMVAAGIDLTNKSTRNTVLGWLADEETAPGVGITKANAHRIDRAYEARRRHTMVPSLKRRLSAGSGAQVEVHPPGQAADKAQYARDLKKVRVNIRPSKWKDIVDAWDRNDWAELNDIWDGIADDQIYPPGAYAIVSSMGIGA
jgi:hypothetical protein